MALARINAAPHHVHQLHKGAMVRTPFGISKANEPDFPMHVVPIATILRMTRMETHEDLLGTGEVVEFKQHMQGKIMFVSHTWLCLEHPDPEGVQLRVLQAFCRSLQRAEVPVRVFWQQEFLFGAVQISAAELAEVEYVWLDYASIPQAAGGEARESRRRAIGAIAQYVFNSRFFMVVAPPATHRKRGQLFDYRTWGSRGWCRVELFAHAVAKGGQIIVAEGESNFYLDMAGARDALLRPPGLGNFSFNSDKEELAPLLATLVDMRIDKEAKLGSCRVRRLFQASRAQVLQGMGGAGPELSFDEWMQHLGFTSAMDGEGGWTPLRYAVYAARYDVAQRLLEQGADVEAPLREELAGHGYHVKGCSILGGLAFMRDDPEGIAWLVSSRADPCWTMERKFFPLSLAAICGNLGNVQALLAKRADPHQVNGFGDDGAGSAVLGGQAEVARLLIKEHGGQFEVPINLGWNSAFASVVAAGDAQMLSTVLELRADLNFQNNNAGFALTSAMQAAYYFQHRNPTKAVELFSQLPGMTPLAGACYFGNLAQARILLEARADASITNCYSRTPLSFAAAKGQLEMLQELLEAAPQCLNVPDCWGLRPLDHAVAAHNSTAASFLRLRGGTQRSVAQGLNICCCKESTNGTRVMAESVRAERKPVFASVPDSEEQGG